MNITGTINKMQHHMWISIKEEKMISTRDLWYSHEKERRKNKDGHEYDINSSNVQTGDVPLSLGQKGDKYVNFYLSWKKAYFIKL